MYRAQAEALLDEVHIQRMPYPGPFSPVTFFDCLWPSFSQPDSKNPCFCFLFFPATEYLQDGFLYAIRYGLPLLLMLSLIFSALTIVRVSAGVGCPPVLGSRL